MTSPGDSEGTNPPRASSSSQHQQRTVWTPSVARMTGMSAGVVFCMESNSQHDHITDDRFLVLNLDLCQGHDLQRTRSYDNLKFK